MLTRLVKDLIDSETWLALSADVKGDAYESLLERNAQDVKTGAGQYFTPRPLIQAMVDVMRPEPDTTICDPACGTGGFLLAAHDYIVRDNQSMNQGQLEHLQNRALFGWDNVAKAARLGVMNLYLHGIGGDETNIVVDDSLRTHPGVNFDMVLTNPPFGKKSSLTFVGSDGEAERESLVVERPDFWATSSNKQLNFLQHVRSLLKIHGRAAIVVPDNVLFEGGAGETVRRHMLDECDVHTLLRLPTGIFYAQGVKANVLFFDRKPASETPWTRELWIYDLRTNRRFTLKTSPLTRVDLDDFVACYNLGSPASTSGSRTLPPVQLRRSDEARQSEPRHLLAPRREHGRLGQLTAPGSDRLRNRRRSPIRLGAARGNCGGPVTADSFWAEAW